MNHRRLRLAGLSLALALALVLTACGGGGGTSYRNVGDVVVLLEQHELGQAEVAPFEFLGARGGLTIEILSPGAYQLEIYLFVGRRGAEALANTIRDSDAAVLAHAEGNAAFLLATTRKSDLEALVKDLRGEQIDRRRRR